MLCDGAVAGPGTAMTMMTAHNETGENNDGFVFFFVVVFSERAAAGHRRRRGLGTEGRGRNCGDVLIGRGGEE